VRDSGREDADGDRRGRILKMEDRTCARNVVEEAALAGYAPVAQHGFLP